MIISMHLSFNSIIAKPPLYLGPIGEVDNKYLHDFHEKHSYYNSVYLSEKKKPIR